MSRLVISDEYPDICVELAKRGYDIISTDTVEAFHKPEQRHADMQVLPLGDKLFILRECNSLAKKLQEDRIVFCEKEAGKLYPKNVILNCLHINGAVYGKVSAIDNSVKEYCRVKGIKIRDVNQGYARCSTLSVNEKTVITADKSIEKAMRTDGIDVLLIQPGNIKLEGFDCGFIGGCSAALKNGKVYFFGNIGEHPDYKRIDSFLNYHNVKYEILCPEMPLTDIGGAVEI